MKQFNKYILEAIDRGIQLALDDFENIEDNNSISSDIIDTKDIIDAKIKFKKFSQWIHACSFYIKSNTLLTKAIFGISKICKEFPFKFKPKDKFEFQYIIDILIADDPNINLNWLDTSEIDEMQRLFMNKDFTGDISEWDVSNVTNMNDMFYGSTFNGDISKWNVINVRTAHEMFAHSRFNQPIGNWKFSSLKDGDEMFWGTTFNQDITQWDNYIQDPILRDLLVGANFLKKQNRPKAYNINK